MDIARAYREVSTNTSECPLSMYQNGLIEKGVRGFDIPLHPEPQQFAPPDAAGEPLEAVPDADLPDYGVDWAALQQQDVVRSNRRNNPQVADEIYRGPAAPLPEHMSHVEVLPPNCPFDDPQDVDALWDYVAPRVDLTAVDMTTMRLRWVIAYQYCANYVRTNGIA